MDQQARQRDVNVAEAVDDRDAVILQDCPCLGGGLASDEQQRQTWASLHLVHELPCGGRRGVMPDLDSGMSVAAGEVQGGVPSAVRPSRLGGHGQARGCSEDAEGLGLERALDVHSFWLIHSDCEHSTNSEPRGGPGGCYSIYWTAGVSRPESDGPEPAASGGRPVA